jgi:DNA-binding NtrC family response regulator
VVIPTPPLRERQEDIPVLAQYFLGQENNKYQLHVRGFAKPAMHLLEQYPWPGNIRELRNVVSSVVVLKQRGMIEVTDLPPEIQQGRPLPGANLPVPLGRDPIQQERELLAATLLELREDIKDIKSMLMNNLTSSSGGALRFGEDVVDTFVGETGYSPIPVAEGGDLQSAEKAMIAAALKAADGNRRKAAERLGISERTLYRKIKRYGL